MLDSASFIKEKIDIIDFIGKYIKLTAAGRNFKAVCPFHKEKTPSLMVSSDKQIWHCFGCGNGGDVIKFLMLYENLEFYDALKVLAERAGVNLEILGGRDFKSYNNLYNAMEAAKEFYRINLYKSDEVKNYLKSRGLKGETVKEFELGAAPEDYDALSRYLLKKGFSIGDLEKAGLIFKTERGTYWDRFRGRLMFPIYNHVGKVVGFTGRILPGRDETNTGKYVNSPETPIFQKSKILYGFHKTKNDIREQNRAVLVEGQMDFLMMWQDGIKNVVATSGTALTSDQLKVLRKISDELVLSFDSDAAGQSAAERSIDLAAASDFSVKLLVIEDPKFKDPADVVKEKPGMIAELVISAKPAMEYYIYKYITNADVGGDLKKNKQNLRQVLTKIKGLASSIEQNHWLKELSVISKVGETVLMEEMDKLKTISIPVAVEEKSELELSENEFNRRDLICQRLLGLSGNNKDVHDKIKDYLEYMPDLYKDLYKGRKLEGASEKVAELIGLRFSFENSNLNEKDLREEFDQLVRELKLDFLKEKQLEIRQEIEELEKSGKDSELVVKMKEFDSVSREMHNIRAGTK